MVTKMIKALDSNLGLIKRMLEEKCQKTLAIKLMKQ